MPINLLDTGCKTTSHENKFGLCDDPPPATNPAYIDENDSTKWIGIVDNPTNKNVDFYAVDHCVSILRPNGETESRCNGILYFDNSLIFVELKDRAYGGWLGTGRNQLTTSITIFRANHNIGVYTNIGAYVSNKQRPRSSAAHNVEIQKFKDDTGLILNVKQNISI